MTYLHWPGTGVGCKNFYETLFARAAAMLQELQKFAVYYPHHTLTLTLDITTQNTTDQSRE